MYIWKKLICVTFPGLIPIGYRPLSRLLRRRRGRVRGRLRLIRGGGEGECGTGLGEPLAALRQVCCQLT